MKWNDRGNLALNETRAIAACIQLVISAVRRDIEFDAPCLWAFNYLQPFSAQDIAILALNFVAGYVFGTNYLGANESYGNTTVDGNGNPVQSAGSDRM